LSIGKVGIKMGRKKGTKLTQEQKEKMAEKRLKKAKKIELINSPIIKRNKNDVLIAGYGFNENDIHPVPIFTSELKNFRGKKYKTLDKAIMKFKEQRGII